MTDLDNAAPKVDTSTDHMSCVAQNLRGLTHFRKNADDIDALADERDALQSQVELLRKERDALQSTQSYTYIGKGGKPVLARDLEDERDDLRAIIAEFRDIRMTVVYPPDDQDGEPQAVMDLSTWQAWQDDARAALASTKGG